MGLQVSTWRSGAWRPFSERGEMSHSSRARVVLWLRWRASRSADPRAGRSKGPTTALDIPPATTSQACPPNPSRSPREVLHHSHGHQTSLPKRCRPKKTTPPPHLRYCHSKLNHGKYVQIRRTNSLPPMKSPPMAPSQDTRYVPTRRRATTGGHNSREPEGGRAQHQHIHQYQHQHQQYTRTCSTAIQIAFVASSAYIFLRGGHTI